MLFPLCFCRECGHEYYTVRISSEEDEARRVMSRDFGDRLPDENSEAGYLYIGSHKPWPHEIDELINGEHLPDDWK